MTMLKLFKLALSLLALLRSSAAAPFRVASLSNHDGGAWNASASLCWASELARVHCNIDLYIEAAKVAAAEGAQLINYPEGYGISGFGSSDGFFEPWLSGEQGSIPCDTVDAEVAPQQHALSCAARELSIAVRLNVFVSHADGTNGIEDVVFGPDGTVVATYRKHHMFPTEVGWAAPGPLGPVTFELFGRTFGLIICYEGVWPTVPFVGNWDQMDELAAQGADTFLWTVGGGTPLPLFTNQIASKYDVAMISSEANWDAVVVGGGGSEAVELADAAVTLPGYTAPASVLVADLIQGRP